ncbi:DUF6506 family protein [Desulfogranum marinum]|jgi:hypothetical protein|uniref:DUF6506 family protein n=1 Tax=Desulfogranum marinum TaxID=453220 RepID=UPI0029C61CDF|nr:DUF6506 family protein [Desulfogranum marinum]
MSQFQYGYIIKAPGYSTDGDLKVLESEAFKSSIIGVATVEEACKAAQQMVEKQVTLIELCSGFKADDAKTIFDAIEGAAKVGYIGEFFSKE